MRNTERIRQVGQRRRIAMLVIAVLVIGLAAAACGSSDSSASTTTPTAVARTTDTFTGTVPVGGHDFHSFPIAATGIVDVTLTAAAPPATIVMGLSVGTPADGKCTALAGASTTAVAGSGVQLSGMTTAGTLCVDVHDVGNQSAAVAYTVTVTHP
jgi:hypothetical protein